MAWKRSCAPGGVGGGVAEVVSPVPLGEPVVDVEAVGDAGLGGSTVLGGTALGWLAS